jgi:hypothetical protein
MANKKVIKPLTPGHRNRRKCDAEGGDSLSWIWSRFKVVLFKVPKWLAGLKILPNVIAMFNSNFFSLKKKMFKFQPFANFWTISSKLTKINPRQGRILQHCAQNNPRKMLQFWSDNAFFVQISSGSSMIRSI